MLIGWPPKEGSKEAKPRSKRRKGWRWRESMMLLKMMETVLMMNNKGLFLSLWKWAKGWGWGCYWEERLTPTDGPQLELQWEVELLREIQGLHKECRERGRGGVFFASRWSAHKLGCIGRDWKEGILPDDAICKDMDRHWVTLHLVHSDDEIQWGVKGDDERVKRSVGQVLCFL